MKINKLKSQTITILSCNCLASSMPGIHMTDTHFTKTDNFLSVSPFYDRILKNPVYFCGFPRNIPFPIFPTIKHYLTCILKE